MTQRTQPSMDAGRKRGLGARKKTKLYVPPSSWAAPVAVSQESEHRLFLDLAKDAFARQVAKRVRALSRGYVERWMKGEFWLYPDIVRRHGTELRAFKPVVVEVLKATSVDEMLDICRRTRPDLTYLWHEPAARERLTREIEEAIKSVETL